MSLIKTTKSAAKIAEAFQSGDAKQMESAWDAFGNEIAESIRADFDLYSQSKDDQVLANRGYRTLTAKETAWYTGIAQALKRAESEQAFIDILGDEHVDDLMPETVIEDVLRYLIETRPLLSKIRFANAGYSTKWIINDSTVQKGSWGTIDSKVTNEIKGALKVLDITQAKYTAFCIIPLDLLDMGPVFLDAFIRAVLAEALGYGLEDAAVNGTGVNMPIGMTKNPNGDFNQSTGYPDKEKVAVTSFAPVDYGKLVAKVARTEKGKMRDIQGVVLLVNTIDYLTKVMPATTVLAPEVGGYVRDLFPFPTEVIKSNVVKTGTAVLGVLEDYTLAVGGKRNGAITFDDSVHFLDDARTFKLIQHAAGRAYDNTSFAVLDISNLDPAYVTVKNVNAFAAAAATVETQSDTSETSAVEDAAELPVA
ncbi:phage major capsid protein [Collinsella aerofaciens]|uniref:phage major capsid protein n=1 Tax=Collinsella aerofaciens TaxID=74426 RepID=UPI00325AD5E1